MLSVQQFCRKNTTTSSSALTERTPRTITEYELKLEKIARVAGILREICEDIAEYKGLFYREFSFS